MKTKWLLAFFFLWVTSAPAGAVEPTHLLDPLHSSIGFVSVKDETVQVPGTFKKMSGEFRSESSDQGERLVGGFVEVDLDSLQTVNNPGRDQNIRNFFFQTSKDPKHKKAVFAFDPKKPVTVPSGKDQEVSLDGNLTLHGRSIPLVIPVTVVREGGTIHVKSRGAIVLPFASWNLVSPVKALMKVCGHKALQQSATLNFDLQFNAR